MENTRCFNKTPHPHMELVPSKIGGKETSQTSFERKSDHLEVHIWIHWTKKLGGVVEQIACQKRHPNVESLKDALVKAAAKFPMAKIHESIDDWSRRLCCCVRAKEGHFEWLFCVAFCTYLTTALTKYTYHIPFFPFWCLLL